MPTIRTNKDGLVIYPNEFKAFLARIIDRAMPILDGLYGMNLSRPGIVYSPYQTDFFIAYHTPKDNMIVVSPDLLARYLKGGRHRAYAKIAIVHELAHGYMDIVTGRAGQDDGYESALKELRNPNSDVELVASHKEYSSRERAYAGIHESLVSLSASFAIARMKDKDAGDIDAIMQLLALEDARLARFRKNFEDALKHPKIKSDPEEIDAAIHIFRTYSGPAILLAEIYAAVDGATVSEMLKVSIYNASRRVRFPSELRHNGQGMVESFDRQIEAIRMLRKNEATYDAEPGPAASISEKITYAMKEIDNMQARSSAAKATLAARLAPKTANKARS